MTILLPRHLYSITNMAARKSCILLFLIICVGLCVGKGNLVVLNEDNWDKMLKGEWMVEFYAPWCPACKSLQPVWDDFAGWSADLGISVAKVDVTTSSGLSGRFLVTALPTIYHVLNGEFRQYQGGRDKDSFISFIEEKKWKVIETIPSWKSPGSIQMSVVSFFFRLSTLLRSMHAILVEQYGLPIWATYVVFAVATIVIGAFLGLVLVCIIDCIYPPKTHRPSPLAMPDEIADIDEADDLLDEGAESEELESPSQSQSEADLSQDDSADKSDTKEFESSPTMRKRRARKAD